MTTQRCTPAERAVFNARYPKYLDKREQQLGEPALGTVDERLSIIISRMGVRQRIVLTRAERAEIESYRVAS